MHIGTIVICAVTALGLSACGSAGSRSASSPPPPDPVVLSALVGANRLSISPQRVGAGPVLLTVTNQGRRAAALMLSRAGRSVARTAPINPQGAIQIKVDLTRGRYRLAIAQHGAGTHRTDAERSRGPAPAAGALLTVGRRRASSANDVLGP